MAQIKNQKTGKKVGLLHRNGYTALIIAVLNNRMAMMSCLLSQDANIEATDKY